MLKIIDVRKPDRISNDPSQTMILLDLPVNFRGFTINKVELRLYEEKNERNLETSSLITSFVETDKGSIEITYYEGFGGSDALEKTGKFLKENLGLSGLLLRCIVVLESELEDKKSLIDPNLDT